MSSEQYWQMARVELEQLDLRIKVMRAADQAAFGWLRVPCPDGGGPFFVSDLDCYLDELGRFYNFQDSPEIESINPAV